MRRLPPNAFATAASNTRTLARQMSAPVPSPFDERNDRIVGDGDLPASPRDRRAFGGRLEMRELGMSRS
jgi:hypothetical protein